MATKTLGTNANNTLTAVAMAKSLSDADVATISQAILNDKVLADSGVNQMVPGAFVRDGLLYIPRRGVLKVMVGDWVGVDASGWPILVSQEAIAFGGTSWTHS